MKFHEEPVKGKSEDEANGRGPELPFDRPLHDSFVTTGQSAAFKVGAKEYP
jgi:hypothetical protein